ncbi:MAG: serpin family protein [Clostridiales bacterium]|nr:serpin family protein [Clostridiales bacterium]
MIKKTIAAAMAAMLFMAGVTGCTGLPEKKSDLKSGLVTLKSSGSDNVFSDLEELSYKEAINDNGYLEFVFDFGGKSCEGKSENVMVSPASLLFALQMAGSGAKGNTLDEISSVLVPGASNEEALGFTVDYYNTLADDKTGVLKVANAAFINSDLAPRIYEDYLDFISEELESEIYVAEMNQATLDDINEWVDDRTDGMIDKLVSSLDSDTAMVLLNAVVFNAQWENSYSDEDVLENRTFTDYKGQQEDVTLLYSLENNYYSTDKAIGFKKLYEGGDYAFIAILPNDRSIDANEFLASFTADDYREFLDSRYGTDVYAYIPEFSFDYSDGELVKLLSDLGISDAFDKYAADFGNIAEADELYISEIIQKTHIELDREGTKAAAATAVVMTYCDSVDVSTPKEVRLDRPFVFAIVDTATDTPVFLGTVNSVNG